MIHWRIWFASKARQTLPFTGTQEIIHPERSSFRVSRRSGSDTLYGSTWNPLVKLSGPSAMSASSPSSTEGFAWWFVSGSGLVVAAALFSSTREKPPVLFAIGLGLAAGLGLRLLATSFRANRDRRVPWQTGLIVACGFVLSFVPSYQRAARQWNAAVTRMPSDPIAAALLKSAAENQLADEVPRYSISQYLQQRFRNWSPPWPVVMFCAELVSCSLLAGGVAAWHPRRANPAE